MTEQEFGRGVLHPAVQAGVATLTRPDPSPRLAGFVEFYWHVSWDARDRPYETKVLSHPNVHLVFEDPEPTVYGVDRGLFVRRLEGVGQVLGVKFLPGGFRPLADGPVVRLRDRRVPAAEYFGPEVEAVGRVVRTATDLSQAVMAVEAFLDPLLPARPDPAAVEVAGIVERLVADPGVVRVDQAAAVAGVSVRALQRLFAEYVGASPKWVLRRAPAGGGGPGRQRRRRRLGEPRGGSRLCRPGAPHPRLHRRGRRPAGALRAIARGAGLTRPAAGPRRPLAARVGLTHRAGPARSRRRALRPGRGRGGRAWRGSARRGSSRSARRARASRRSRRSTSPGRSASVPRSRGA